MRTAPIVAMTLSVFAAPLYADVLPSRRASDGEGKAQQQVALRVGALGLAGSEARNQTFALLGDEAAFFAAHPDRIQVVGAPQDMFSGETSPFSYETIIGGVMVATGFLVILLLFMNSE